MIIMSILQMGTLRLREINNWPRSPMLGSVLEPEFGFRHNVTGYISNHHVGDF